MQGEKPQVAVISDGQIAESGTHDELLEKNMASTLHWWSGSCKGLRLKSKVS